MKNRDVDINLREIVILKRELLTFVLLQGKPLTVKYQNQYNTQK